MQNSDTLRRSRRLPCSGVQKKDEHFILYSSFNTNIVTNMAPLVASGLVPSSRSCSAVATLIGKRGFKRRWRD